MHHLRVLNPETDWSEIQAWRKAKRAELIAVRRDVSPGERLRIQSVVAELLGANFAELSDACIGFYWPFRGEIDLRPFVRRFLGAGADAALPVVVEAQQPLEFWDWFAKSKMSRGVWNIPVPAMRKVVQPTVLLMPLLGFDNAGYRLGYGGGYYDRTLAALRLKPMTIGIGYESGRLATIYPQAHDIPLDAIVTEAGCTRFDKHRSGYSSPTCYAHEFNADGSSATED